LLIDYLERFLGDLVLATNEISQKILLLERVGIRHQFRAIAQQALTDVLNTTSRSDAECMLARAPVFRPVRAGISSPIRGWVRRFG
jgi:hypothetical protein